MSRSSATDNELKCFWMPLFAIMFAVGCGQRKESQLVSEVPIISQRKPESKLSAPQNQERVSEVKAAKKDVASATKAETIDPISSFALLQSSSSVEPPSSEASNPRKQNTIIAPLGVSKKKNVEQRTWTSKEGKFRVSATCESIKDDKVLLRKVDGKISEVPVEMLSGEDQNYIKELLQEDPKADVIMGKVAAVVSGVMLELDDAGGLKHVLQLEGIRLSGEILPDLDAAKFLITKLTGKHCWFETRSGDNSKVVFGILYSDGESLNQTLVAQGLVKYDPESRLDLRLERAERLAKAKQLGIWGKSSN